MRFTLRTGGERTPVTTPVLGRMGVHNALAGAAVGAAVGMTPAAIATALGAGFSAPHRTTLLTVGPWTILDDSYNASPDAMVATLELLATLPGRHVAVLGEMLELGPASSQAHADVGTAAARVAEVLVTVGAGGHAMAEAARAAGVPAALLAEAEDADEALLVLLPRLAPGDAILVKGSRGVGLDRLVDRLVSLAAPGSGSRA